MNKLDDIILAQSYVGKSYDIDKLLSVSYQSGDNRYKADCHSYNEELLNLFGITSILFEGWGCFGIELSIFINTKDNRIESCGIDKCKYSCGGHGRPSVKVLKPTQQEIRIFKRIMEYIAI